MNLEAGDIPILPRGVRVHRCEVRRGWLLLAPERALKLDDVGVAILGEVNGKRSVGDISATLAAAYETPLDRISGDVASFLGHLTMRRMIDVQKCAS